MTDDTGNLSGVGYKNPPKDTRFGQPKGNKANRKGRPKSFDALRKLAQQIAAEELQSTDGDTITRIEALLRVMSTSRNPADRKTFLEYAYGKPKDEVDITSGGDKITEIRVIWDNDAGTDTPTETPQSTETG